MKSSFLQFQIEKSARGALQLEEIYKASRFKLNLGRSRSLRTKFGKKPVADASKERALRLPQRRIHCAATSFSGSAEVAAGLSNPPTLGRVRRVGAFTGDGIGCTVERKLYGGRGLGLVGCPHVSAEVFKIGGFMVVK